MSSFLDDDDKLIDTIVKLRSCYEHAKLYSTDPSTQNAAFLVTDSGLIVAKGANHFPKGVEELPERWVRPAKYKWVEHAERNAIYTAAREGRRTEGLTMYAAWAACTDCARSIIQAGIKEVITHHNPVADMRFNQPASPTWLEEIKIALVMFKEAGVKFTYIDTKLFEDDSLQIRFNEKLVSP